MHNKSHNTKKPSHVLKEDKIKEKNADKANVLTMLRDKYHCAIHNNKYCYVEGDRHLNYFTFKVMDNRNCKC